MVVPKPTFSFVRLLLAEAFGEGRSVKILAVQKGGRANSEGEPRELSVTSLLYLSIPYHGEASSSGHAVVAPNRLPAYSCRART